MCSCINFSKLNIDISISFFRHIWPHRWQYSKIHSIQRTPCTTISACLAHVCYVSWVKNDSMDFSAEQIVNHKCFLFFFKYIFAGSVVYLGVKFVNRFASVALACVIFSIIAVYVGVFHNYNGNDKLQWVARVPQVFDIYSTSTLPYFFSSSPFSTSIFLSSSACVCLAGDCSRISHWINATKQLRTAPYTIHSVMERIVNDTIRVWPSNSMWRFSRINSSIYNSTN